MRIYRLLEPDKIVIELSDNEFCDLQQLVSEGYDWAYGAMAQRTEPVYDGILEADV